MGPRQPERSIDPTVTRTSAKLGRLGPAAPVAGAAGPLFPSATDSSRGRIPVHAALTTDRACSIAGFARREAGRALASRRPEMLYGLAYLGLLGLVLLGVYEGFAWSIRRH